jgi:DNA-binding response OmpR family regulator
MEAVSPTEPPKSAPPTLRTKIILLVDDNDDIRMPTKWFLNNFGYAVDSVRSAEEALALFNPNVHDLIITDNSMPGMTGSEMAHIVKMRSPRTFVVMYSGGPPEDRACLDSVVHRPAHLIELKEAVEELLAAEAGVGRDHRKKPELSAGGETRPMWGGM